ncbi:DUF4124 domain-containing protein [Ottowia sp.]|uniref:DUF4124 domain-containing protein n=1 Tax=Ottowia sp. TaxID=1898956 RepID=UPI003A89B571
MKAHRALFFGLALACSLSAFAQYSWIDKTGRKVFSDRPPSNDVPAKNVLTQPRGAGSGVITVTPSAEEAATTTAASTKPAATAAAAPASAASAAPSGQDKALEEKKKQAEAAEAAQKKADADRLAAARADNCKRAMNSKAMLDSGQRVARMNDKGEREIMDDTQRSAELERINKIIAADCK